MGALENRFSLIDDILELRFESLKISIDKLLNQSLNELEKLQDFLVKKTKNMGENENNTSVETIKCKIIIDNVPFKTIKQIHIGNTDLIEIQVKLAYI